MYIIYINWVVYLSVEVLKPRSRLSVCRGPETQICASVRLSRSWNPDPVCPSVEVLKPRSRLSVCRGPETHIPNCKSKIIAQKPAWLLFFGFSWNSAVLWGFFLNNQNRQRFFDSKFFFKYPELVILWLRDLFILIPILQIPRRGGYSTYQIPAQYCLYNKNIRQNISLGGGGDFFQPQPLFRSLKTSLICKVMRFYSILKI